MRIFDSRLGRKVKCLILLAVSSIILITLYIKYDAKGYEYGWGCNLCSKQMPYGVSPYTESMYLSFMLVDGDGDPLIDKGIRLYTFGFTINKFLSYGYSDTSIVVQCTDSIGRIRYLTSYVDQKPSNNRIDFREVDKMYIDNFFKNYQWFQINEEEANMIRFLKFIFLVGTIVVLSFLVRCVYNLGIERKIKG